MYFYPYISSIDIGTFVFMLGSYFVTFLNLKIVFLNTRYISHIKIQYMCMYFKFQFFPSILTFGLLWFIGGLLLKACAIQNYFKYHAGDSVSHICMIIKYVALLDFAVDFLKKPLPLSVSV